MIDFSVLSLYVVTLIVFLGTPGPITLLIANTGIKHGMSASVKTVLGTNFASLILIALSFFIINGLMHVNEQLLYWLSLLGGLYLAYLAFHMMRDTAHIEEQDAPKPKNFLRNGIILGLSSPKDVLFFIAFFPAFFTITDNPIVAIIILTVVWIICDFTVLMLFAFVFSKLINDRIAEKVAKISGAILLLIALYALYHGASNLWSTNQTL